MLLEVVTNCVNLKSFRVPGVAFVDDSYIKLAASNCRKLEVVNLKSCIQVCVIVESFLQFKDKRSHSMLINFTFQKNHPREKSQKLCLIPSEVKNVAFGDGTTSII